MRAISWVAALLVIFSSPAAAAAPTSEENLDCAVWASIVIGTSEDEAVRNGVGFVLGYFIGLYEGATGRDIDAALEFRAAAITPEELQAINDKCAERMAVYGERMGALGQRMIARGDK